MKNQNCYAQQLKNVFGSSVNGFQLALKRLEKGRVLVSFRIGKTLVFQFNPQYPFLAELLSFLEKAYKFLPNEMQKKVF